MKEFVVDDVVRTNCHGDKSNNMTGRIVCKSTSYPGYYLVNFGHLFSGHDGGAETAPIPTKYRNNNNWHVAATHLALVSSAIKTESITTKGETKMNIDFNKLGKDIVSDNIQFAKFEAERKIGQTALDVSVEAFCKQFPSFRQTADTNIGKLAIANLVRVLGNQYKGANKEAVDMFTSAVMRGGYANASDSIDLEKMFDGLVDKFKSIIPTGLISEKTETTETSAK